MQVRIRTALKILVSTVVLVLIGILAGLVEINLESMKPHIERFAKNNLDLDVAVQGRLRVRLGLNPQLDATTIEISQSGTAEQPLLRVDKLSLRPRLFAVLRGRLHLDAAQVSGVQFDYCAPFPTFAGTPGNSPPQQSIAADSVAATNLRLYCGDHIDRLTPDIVVSTLDGRAPVDQPISARIRGQVEGLPFEIDATTANLNEILADPSTASVKVDVAAEGAELRLEGHIRKPLSRPEFQAEARLRMRQPQHALSYFGIDIPEIPEIDVAGQAWLNLETVGIEDLTGRIGDSSLNLSAELRFSGERNYFDVDAKLSHLHRGLFGDMSTATGNLGSTTTSNLLPLYRFLMRIDGTMHLAIDQLEFDESQFTELDLTAHLDDGDLFVSRGEMNFQNSSISAKARLDMRGSCGELSANVQIADIDLNRWAKTVTESTALTGKIRRAELEAQSCGNTLAEFQSASGIQLEIFDAKIGSRDAGLFMQADRVSAEVGWALPSRVVAVGKLLDESIAADISVGALNELPTGIPWRTSIQMVNSGASMTLSGNAAIHEDSQIIDARMAVDVPYFGALHRWIAIDRSSELPASANARIRWKNKTLLIDEFNADIGGSDLSGRIELVRRDGQRVLLADIWSNLLNVQELREIPAQDDIDQPRANPSEVPDSLEAREFLQDVGLSSIELDLHVDQLTGTRFDVRSLGLKGIIDDRIVEDAELSVRVDGVEFAGAFNIDLRRLPVQVLANASATNLDIGELLQKLELADNTQIDANRVHIEYSSQGSTLREIAVKGETLAEIEHLSLVAERPNSEESVDLNIAHLIMDASPERSTGWEVSGSLDGIPFDIRAQTAPLGDILNGVEHSPLAVSVASGDNAAMLSGAIDWSIPGEISGDVAFSAGKTDPETFQFSRLESRLPGFQLSADVTVRKGEIEIADLDASIGSSRANGHGRVTVNNGERSFELSLSTPHIQTNDFVQIVQTWREIQPDTKGTETPNVNAEPHRLQDVVREYIEAQTLDNRFQIDLNVDALYAGEQHLGNARLKLLADNDNFRLQPFKVALPTGGVNAEYIVERTPDGVELVSNISVDRLQYGDLIRLVDPEAKEGVRGLLYLNSKLTSSAPTTAQLTRYMRGRVESLIIPEDIAAGVLDVWAANLVLELITPKDRSQPKKLNCIVANFEVDDGVMQSDYVALDTTDVIIRGRGQIDLEANSIDMIVAPQAKLEKFLSVSTPVTVYGPWSDVQVGVKRSGLVGTFLRLYYGIIYVPYKRMTGERFPKDGLTTCFAATDWDLPSTEDDK